MSVDVRAKVRGCIEQRLGKKNNKVAITDSDSLFVSGLLDSLDAIWAILFLEDEYRINFAAMEFDLTLLDSIDAIVALLDRMQSTGGTPDPDDWAGRAVS